MIHFHTDMIHFPIFEDMAAQTVTTLHGRLDLKDLPEVYAPLAAVPAGLDQRRPAPPVARARTGPPPCITAWRADLYRFSPRAEGYLAFLGRISPEKRPDRAIAIATARGPAAEDRRQGRQRRPRPTSRTRSSRCCDDPLVEFIGEIGDGEKSAFLGGADALLFPIDWPEPFGLVMIEAMACGTPVIAWRRGSVPEVIEDGLTGFIVAIEDEAADGDRPTAQLDRAAIRARFEERFSAMAMAHRYLRSINASRRKRAA